MSEFRLERIQYDLRLDYSLAQKMVDWGKIMGDKEMVPYVEGYGWAGNIGFRDKGVVWVTPSGCVINEIQLEDIMGIKREGNRTVFFGNSEKKPTSEWEIYWSIFERRPDVNVILHGHDQIALRAAEKLYENYPSLVALTRGVTESGSPEFKDEMLDILTDTNLYLIGRKHGFFALGKTFEEVGELSLEFRKRAELINNLGD